MGTSSIVYVSIADTTTTCANLGLPTLPTGYTYNCATAANLKKADGTGWIPVNFKQITFGSPLSNLPIDPINTTSSRNYYTYVPGGSWDLSTTLESAKNKLGGANDKVSTDGGTYPDLYEVGSKLTLNPIDWGDSSLVGYWNFEEGSGGTAKDLSGNGNNGTWVGTSTSWYATGKVGSYAGSFNGSSDYTNLTGPGTAAGQNSTIVAWFKRTSSVSSNYSGIRIGSVELRLNSNNTIELVTYTSQGYVSSGYLNLALNEWHQVVGSYNGSLGSVYFDGTLIGSGSGPNPGPMAVSSGGSIGLISTKFPGYIDDVRVYNRALSAAEILALYNATK